MTITLEGRIALVGGATRGIGWAIAQALSYAGASVILVARDKNLLEARTAFLAERTGRLPHAIAVDFDSPRSVQTFVNELRSHALVPDIIINNAGGPPPGAIIDAEPGHFHRALDRLILTAHQILQFAAPYMREKRWGRIINIISTSVRQPIDGLGVSNTLRAATAAWAKTLATELAPYGITVNSILPGATRTERLRSIIEERAHHRNVSSSVIEQEMIAEVPLGRFIEPEEIAHLAVFLCSDYAAAITGECIRVDGGRTRTL